LYFRQLNPEKEHREEKEETLAHSSDERVSLYQCSNCLTIYDEKLGDPESDISPGTVFEDLPENYQCSVCNSSRRYFIPLKGKLEV
jgi:rubredoxin